HRREILIDREPTILEDHEIVGVGGPRPGLDRRRMRRTARREFVGREAGGAGRPDRTEQPQLEPEMDQPRAVEAGQAGDEVVEAVVVAHRPDCRMAPCAGGARRGYRTGMQRSVPPAGSGGWMEEAGAPQSEPAALDDAL